jgi:2-aminoadipate transaminase
VALDADGLQVDELERVLAGGARPKLLYTIPDHQNPAGVSLSVERREALVELARRYGFLVVEDVAYRELRFEGEWPPSLWSLAPDTVAQVGTTSKTFMPGFRLGGRLRPKRWPASSSAPSEHRPVPGGLGQRMPRSTSAAAGSRSSRSLARSTRRKCERLLAALERTPAWRELDYAEGGLFSWLTVPGSDTTARRVRRRPRCGHRSRRAVLPRRTGGDSIRLSFSQVDESLIDEGVERLAGCSRRYVRPVEPVRPRRAEDVHVERCSRAPRPGADVRRECSTAGTHVEQSRSPCSPNQKCSAPSRI